MMRVSASQPSRPLVPCVVLRAVVRSSSAGPLAIPSLFFFPSGYQTKLWREGQLTFWTAKWGNRGQITYTSVNVCMQAGNSDRGP